MKIVSQLNSLLQYTKAHSTTNKTMTSRVNKDKPKTAAFENDYGDFSQFKKKTPATLPLLEWAYLQYTLVSGLYMLEPWERKMFNCIIILFFTIVSAIFSYFFF